jgi:hypothetical protein
MGEKWLSSRPFGRRGPMTAPEKLGERVPPQNLEAERAVLGSLLLVNEHIDQMAGSLLAEDFYSRGHQLIYGAMLDLHGRGQGVDFLTLRDELRRKDELETVGGIAYISALTDVVPAAANVEHYARIVQDAASRRRLVQLGMDLATGAQDGRDLTRLLIEHQIGVERVAAAGSSLRVVPFDDVIQSLAPIGWLWPGWLPLGFAGLLVGASGIGKSNVALALAKSVLTGSSWPDGSSGPTPGKVLWVEAEGAGAVLRDRVVASGLPTENLLALRSTEAGIADVRWEDWPHIVRIVKERRPSLVVLDSLSGFAVGVDENAVDKVAPVLLALQGLARDYGLSLLTVHHLRKRGASEGDGVDADRVRGSSSILQFTRAVLSVDEPDTTEGAPKRLRMLKSNLAAFPPAVGFRVGAAGVQWCPPPHAPSRSPDLDQARDFLQAELSRGAVKASSLYDRGRQAGVAERTLRRAGNVMGIVMFREGQAWWWGLAHQDKKPDPRTEGVPF